MSCFTDKTVVITGATGLIGSHIVDKLMGLEVKRVIAIGRSKEKLEDVFKDYVGRPDFLIMQQDISDGFPNIDGPVHFIFHAAGPMERKIVENYPMSVISPNLIGTINCLEYLRVQKEKEGTAGRLVLFSSVTVYGNNKDVDVTVSENETDVTGALGASNACYAQAKRMSEVIAQSYYKQYGIDVVIARFSTVYGDTRVIPDTAFYEFLTKAVRGENIEVNNAVAPRRDNIYIDDAVAGVLIVCEKGKSNEAYNISSGGDKGNGAAIDEIAISIAEKANEYFGRSGEDVIGVIFRNISLESRKPGLMMDNGKLKELGWDVLYSMEDGIRQTIRWYADLNS